MSEWLIGLDCIGMDWIELDWIGWHKCLAGNTYYPQPALVAGTKKWSGAKSCVLDKCMQTSSHTLCESHTLQNWSYQPLIPKTSQISAWCHRYIGYWMGKTEDSPTGSRTNSEGWMPAKIPRQKWSISYLWEHFLVPDHRIPIWLVGRLADWLIGSLADWLTHQKSL